MTIEEGEFYNIFLDRSREVYWWQFNWSTIHWYHDSLHSHFSSVK